MGYSKNISTLRRMQDQLILLSQLQPCQWERPSGDADKWAYKIREAMKIAVQVTNEGGMVEDWIKNLAAARRTFEIRVLGPTKVEASFKTDLELAITPTPTVQGMAPHGKAHTIGEVKTLEDLVAVWQQAQPTNDPIHFPNCLLSDQELMLAADWAHTLQPPWMLLRPKGTNAVTLAPNDPRVPDGAKIKGMRPSKGRAAKNDVDNLPTMLEPPKSER